MRQEPDLNRPGQFMVPECINFGGQAKVNVKKNQQLRTVATALLTCLSENCNDDFFRIDAHDH